MTDLFNAIYTAYEESALESSLQAFHNTLAPENAVFPYGVFSLISDVPDWSFTENFENYLIQINLFSETVDATEICALFTQLKTAFDFLDLNIANYETISMVRENSILTKVENVWQYNVLYRVLLGKS